MNQYTSDPIYDPSTESYFVMFNPSLLPDASSFSISATNTMIGGSIYKAATPKISVTSSFLSEDSEEDPIPTYKNRQEG